MHDYAIDAEKRKNVTMAVVLLYVLGAFVFVRLDDAIKTIIYQIVGIFAGNGAAGQEGIYINAVVSILFPGVGVGVLYLVYDRWLWKCKLMVCWHGVPDLSGDWIAEIESPLKNGRKPRIEMKIKQTWNKIRVNGISEAGTSTVSESASLLKQHGQMYFSYSYWIHQEGGQCYPGFNSLKVIEIKRENENGTEKKIELRGQYFSAKNVEEELEQGGLNMVEEGLKRQIKSQIKGCGSKGVIILRKKNE